MSTIVTLEDKTNGLLKRREVKCLFKGYAGKLTRKEAAEILSKELKLDNKFVIPVSLMCDTGMNDVNCTFYVYDEEELAKKHLSKYIFMRMLTKEERKKAREAQKAKKKPEGAPPKAEAPKEEAKEAKAKEKKEIKEETTAETKAEKPKKEAAKEAEAKEKPESKAEKSKKEAKEKGKPEEEAKK